MAEQFEFRLFRRKFCYSRPFVRLPSFWTTFHQCLLYEDPPEWHTGTRSSLLIYRFDPVTKTAHYVGYFPDSRGRFCRQTADAAIDTVANGDEIL